jgi:hypothetical protein
MTLYAFDGTWNSDEADEKNVQDTNVVRFKELYLGNNTEYIEGVGTRYGKIGEFFGGLFGSGGKTRIDEMYEELCENWKNDDKEIDIIGFSRGAALAVHFANKIGQEGIKLKNGKTEAAKIRFLGVWDIVGSFGLSFDTFINFQDINLGWEIDTVHQCVEHCFHAMALDERRETFNVTRLDPQQQYEKIKEVWFRGVHSDIGGGNENVARSNIALQWMLDQARNSGLVFNEVKAELPRYSERDIFAPISENTDVKIDERRDVTEIDEKHSSAEPNFLMRVGDSHTCRVFAKSKYNWSGVTLKAGHSYSFSVPAGAKWKDGSIDCGPAGWESKLLPWYKEGFVKAFEDNRRKPDANWFALIGALGDEDNDLFLIDDFTMEYTATQEIDLYFFANDVPSRYGNNKGFLPVTITRLD